MNEEPAVGTRLRDLRRKRGLSQKELAERAGLSLNCISLIERGEISPNVTTLQRLATALQVTMGDFFAAGEQTNVVHVPAPQHTSITSLATTVEDLPPVWKSGEGNRCC